MLTGVAEMVRTGLLMMVLSCLARAALDEELAGRCTRTAGVAAGGPGLVAIIVFLFVAFWLVSSRLVVPLAAAGGRPSEQL